MESEALREREGEWERVEWETVCEREGEWECGAGDSAKEGG